MSILGDDLSRICNVDGSCHCDWRLTAYGCDEQSALKTIYIVNAAISACGFILVSIILYHRVVHLHQTLLDFRSSIPRPKPIETMAVFGLIFNFLRVVHAIILVTDTAPNVVFRSFFFEFPWQFGYAALACYFFGIANTLSDSSRTLYEAWIRSPIFVDILCLTVISLPFLTNNAVAIAAGVYAQRGNIEIARRFVIAHYILWSIYTGFLGLFIIFAGVRLVRLLNKHLLRRNDVNVDIKKIYTGALKVRLIVAFSSTCLLVFTCILLWYIADREENILNTVYNLVICCIWTYDGAIATILVALAVTLNPQMAALLSGSGLQSVVSAQSPATTFPTGVTSGDFKQAEWSTFSRVSMNKTFSMQRLSTPRSPPPPLPDRIEEEQLQYNAMTSTVRTPPRNTSPTFDELPVFTDSGINGDGSVTSSATRLVVSRSRYTP